MAISNVLQTVWQPVVLRALEEVLEDYPAKAFQVRLWNGTTWGKTRNPDFTVVA